MHSRKSVRKIIHDDEMGDTWLPHEFGRIQEQMAMLDLAFCAKPLNDGQCI